MYNIFENISADFDGELNKDRKMAFEAYIAISKNSRKIAEIDYFAFYQISKSIKQVKQRIINQ